ncbi:MAG: ABC transporter permease, partial [Vicinamibacterales bacterium]|nr:ABC transporter permease [Vicinamibacterales bacterium]
EPMRPYSDSVGLIDFAPLTGAMNRYLYAPSDNAGLSDEFETRAVGRRYFEAMGIRLQQGRTFDPTRTHPDATEVVISEGVGRSFWPGRSPVGQRLLVEDGPALEVIGVVDDIVEQHGASPKRPMVYRQVDGVSRTARFVAARVPKDMTSIRTVVRTAIEELSPEMAVEMYTMAQALTAERATERLALWCSAVGLVIAGLLVHIGTYGVVFSLVRGRRHEIGVRLVVGGPIHRVRREFVMKHLGVVATGVFAGVALAVAGNRFGSAVWAVPQVHEAVVYLGGAAALLIAVPAVVLAVWSASRGEVWRILME